MNTPTVSTKNSTVYINNLSYERDRNGIKSMFSKFGIIKKIKIVVEPSTNQSRGMAFVEMGSPKEASAAIEGLNQKVIDGRTVKVTWAIPMKETSKPKLELKDKTEAPKAKSKKNADKDLDFVSIQLAKKARNDAKRNSNPFTFKVKAKTTTKTNKPSKVK